MESHGEYREATLNVSEVLERLRSEGVVTNTHSLHTTCIYFQLWKDGHMPDLTKSQAQIHRARLRKIGIDIGKPYKSESSEN